MNYAQARPLGDGSGWHFTVRNDSRIWRHPCCDGHDPHPTAEDAERCLHTWRRAQAAEWSEGMWASWESCWVCDTPTKFCATFRDLGMRERVTLCDEHRTTVHVLAYVDEHRITQAAYS